MKVLKKSKAYGAFEYTVIIALVIVAALIVLKIVKGKTNPTFLDTSKAAVDNYIAESTTKIEESVPDTSGIVVDFSEFRYTTISEENVAADVLAALKVSNLAKDKDNVDISDSLEIVQGVDTLHGVGKRTVKLRATDKDSNTKDFFKTIILTQEINDDFLSNYLKAVITEMGVEFSSEEDFNAFVIDFLNDAIAGEFIKDILKAELLEQIEKAEINKDINTLQEGSQPRQIAIPVPDSIIDNLYNKLKNLVVSDVPNLDSFQSMIDVTKIKKPNSHSYIITINNNRYFVYFCESEKDIWEIVDGFYKNYSTKYNFYKNTTFTIFDINYNYTGSSSNVNLKVEDIIYSAIENPLPSYEITLPTGNFNLNWTSPYTGMQTVTIPIPFQAPENKISIYTELSKFTYKLNNTQN